MRGISILAVCVLAVTVGGPARAAERGFEELLRGDDYIIEHPPHPFGGSASDTTYVDRLGQPNWAQAADDFHLFVAATVAYVRWFGFYGDTFDEEIEPPPASEQMRIRFYEADVADGLPSTMVYDATIANHTRALTGESIQELIRHPEYLFEAQLVVPVHLHAGSYWLEIVQAGQIDSLFRWEASRADLSGFAFQTASTPSWTRSGSSIDLAFTLSNIPEPTTVLMLAVAGVMAGPTRGRRAA